MHACLSNLELRTRCAARARSANYSCSSSHLERCGPFSALNSSCEGAAGLVITGVDSETSVASACRIELDLLPKLDTRNY
eukprot:3893521-Pyramimonas_sp.AAC.1